MQSKTRTLLLTAGILAIGAALAFLILREETPTAKDEHTHADNAHAETPAKGVKQDQDGEPAKGPHGGRLLGHNNFALEVTIFEQGVPPEFRVYAYDRGKPIAPAEVKLEIRLDRLGAPPEAISFTPEREYLRGDREIVEPHSFKVTAVAGRKDETYHWEYEQVEGRVRMDDAAAKNAGIEVKAAGPVKIQSVIQLPGEIQFNRDRVAHVVPRLAGVVIRAERNLGDAVKKGDLLAVIESQALSDLKSEYLAAQKRLALARTTFQREKRLWEEKISAEQDYLASRQALNEAEIAHDNARQKLLALGLSPAALTQGGGRLTQYEIRAPLSGVVIEKHLGLGEAVKEDADIFTIADLSTVWAEMTIYPKDLNNVKLGQKVTVRAAALDSEASGQISYVGALVGERTRSAKAQITLQNPDMKWRPGLFVTVELVQKEAEVPVAVPVDAVQTFRDWKVVFGRFGDFFEVRPVELGASDGKWIEIAEGLQAGTQYAATNSFVLKADLGKAGASHDH
jgi:cobalt-zinc-cadmium efflux system membrane fusion protein